MSLEFLNSNQTDLDKIKQQKRNGIPDMVSLFWYNKNKSEEEKISKGEGAINRISRQDFFIDLFVHSNSMTSRYTWLEISKVFIILLWESDLNEEEGRSNMFVLLSLCLWIVGKLVW